MPSAAPLLDDMVLFTALVRAGSLTSAAERLGMRKSTASRRLAALEAHLGVRLVERGARSLRLTEAGRDYHARCLEIVERAEALNRSVRDARGTPQGVLKVGADALLGEGMAPVLAELVLRHPAVRAELTVAEGHGDLLGEACEVAVRAGPLPDSSRPARRLGTLRVGYYASEAYLSRRGAPPTPDALEGHEGVQISSEGADEVWFFTGPDRPRTWRVGGRLRVPTLAAGLSAARAGAGIARLPMWVADGDVRAGLLRPVLEPWTPEGVPVFALHASKRQVPAKVRALLALMSERKDLLPWHRSSASAGEGDAAER